MSLQEDFDELQQMAAEPLDDELKPYVFEQSGMTVLKHPLVFSVPFGMPGWANRQLVAKKQLLAAAEAEENWEAFVFLHERPYRSEAMVAIANRIDDDTEFWDLLGVVWMDSENLHEWGDALPYLLEHRDSGSMMDEEEQEILASMPEVLTVYRGVQDAADTEDGWSWTLLPERAEFFARRFYRSGRVLTGRVYRSRVVAYLKGRGEEEIVVDPQDVDVVSSREVLGAELKR